jgi:pectin methylesterase-like acyl-CoA thioesterase
MGQPAAIRLLGVLAALALLTGARGEVAFTCYPANHATRVTPDTHLVVTFSSPPTLGKSGQIRIYDAADHRLVDTLDLSIPAGPDPSRRIAPPVTVSVLDPAVATSPTTTTPAVRTTPADLRDYQLTTIGGLSDFHFYPVIIHGNVATIYPHNNVLRYNREYRVEIDSGVFTGFSTDHAWRFSTRPAPPPAGITRVVVAADGSGDFSTVQGAVDFVPDHPPKRVTIFIRNGTYEEIVFFRNKADITFRGEDRDKVQVGYGNNSAFNPPQPGPNRRCAFSAYDSTGIEFINFTVSNYFFGQAEALLIYGSKNIVSHMNIKGSGDALNLRGSVYLVDSTIVGDGDTILGVGPAFFRRCEIQSVGPFMWIRNTEANHGNVFVECTFTSIDRPLRWRSPSAPVQISKVLARLPNNHGINYPYAEAVLIRCRLKGVPPAGWGPIDAEPAHIHLWEFHSTDAEGHPIDVTERHPASKQLTEPGDAETIANYSDPAFVLGGWTPVVEQ